MTQRSQSSSHSSYPTFRVLGVQVHAVQIPEVVAQMECWIEKGSPGHFIIVANAHIISERMKDPSLRKVLENASLTVPDGMPLIWLARRRGFPLQRRVYGPDLMWTFLQETSKKGYRHYFYGSTDEVLQHLKARLLSRFPSLSICGMYAPPFRPLTEEEDRQVVQMINEAKPDVLWIGLGCPKQERWMDEHRDRLQVPVMVGVGQAFDIFAGVKRRAPAWMQDHGLEWLFRLRQEPRRLWRRYLIQGARFVYNVLCEELGLKKFD
jgi:N-acetylglucosaminyldiphosphoundecaprenol N-acetyl-beta-D-mannosaminyltransferase